MNSERVLTATVPRMVWAGFALGMVLFALIVFRDVLAPAHVLMTTDDNVGAIAGGRHGLPEGFLGLWNDSTLLGSAAGRIPITWSSILSWALRPEAYVNVIHGLNLILASLGLAVFLRIRGLRFAAAGIGALTYAWLSTNLTLTYAGHIPKFSVLFLAAFALYAVRRAWANRFGWAWNSVTGGLIGSMFVEQQDLALFFGLALGAYCLFSLRPSAGRVPVPRAVAALAVMVLVALALAGPTMFASYLSNVKGVANVSEENPQAKWEFVTQWSQPPDETIDLIAPNYFGIRSGEPEGPYWGRTGRSAGWEQTHQGFMNFRLESIYIGAIPVVLALFAVVAALRGKVSGGRCQVSGGGDGGITNPTFPYSHTAALFSTHSDRRAEILFWACVAVITLLLAYGKYFPLYALFYKLPLVNNIRCPNKFLQPFQLALGILAAYGLDAAVRWPTHSSRHPA